MDGNAAAQLGRQEQDKAWVTADEWFGGGERRWYDPASARLLTDPPGEEGQSGLVKVFGRTTGTASPDAVWLTMLPGFPEGSYGWSRVDQLLPADLGPRLYVEPVGQGDSDKPEGYAYSTVERADLIGAWWRDLGVRRTVVVTFDYTSLALLELLRRQLERPGGPVITAAFMINGGLFADAHSHPLRGTPLLRSPFGTLVARGAQRSPIVFAQGFKQAQMYSAAMSRVMPNWPRCGRPWCGETARGSSTRGQGSSRNTAATAAAGTWPRSPVN